MKFYIAVNILTLSTYLLYIHTTIEKVKHKEFPKEQTVAIYLRFKKKKNTVFQYDIIINKNSPQ